MNKNHPPKQVIYGIHAVEAAINSGQLFERIYITNERKNDGLKNLYQLIKTSKLPHHTVPFHKLQRLTRKAHQGVFAFLEIVPNITLEEAISSTYEKGKDPKVLILDGITDVRNFGAICRSAVAFDFDAVMVPTKGSAIIHEDAVKTSAGAVFNIHVCRVSSLVNSVKQLKDHGLTIVGCTEKKEDSFTKIEGPIALVMGNEHEGIAESLLHQTEKIINIPISEAIDSLNVSVAAGIAMHRMVTSD